MAFLINKTRKKAHEFIMARLYPLQHEIQKNRMNADIQHLLTMQTLRAIAEQLSPDLVAKLPQFEEGGDLIAGDVVVSPNYDTRIKADDIFLLSYPRSGNTWTRVIIAYLLYSAETITTFEDLQTYVPDLHVGLPTHNHYSTPRVLKSHQPYGTRHGLGNLSLYRRYIYIIRHPYKVMESYLHYETYKANSRSYAPESFIDLILNNAYDYGGWQEHVLSWQYAQKYAPKTLFLRYEDLSNNPIPYIQSIGQFLGKPVSEEQAELVRKYSSRESMRDFDVKAQTSTRFETVQEQVKLTDDQKSLIYARYQQEMNNWGYLADGSVANDYAMKGKTFRP